MFYSKYKWNLLNSEIIDKEEQLFNVLLNNRNIINNDERDRFFSDEPSFYDPFLFNDMKKSVERINQAINNKEKIIIYGDYDVDGVTGTAILYMTLLKLGASVNYYIPNRFTEGYGPNLLAFKQFVNDGYTLVITVDNGITGILEANYLLDNNVTLIITDHHEALVEIPKAFAIIHPNLAYENYPYKYLSGCGVVFKLCHALLGYLPNEYIDLAALGTYADLVNVTFENRVILKLGIEKLKYTENFGLKQIKELTMVKTIDEYSLGFVFGPRLNAPGRMLSGNDAVKLLVTTDVNEAKTIALAIEELNNDRKLTIDKIIDEAITTIETNKYHEFNIIVCASDTFHEGVLGIACARLVDYYNKPVILLTQSEGFYKGSARTIADFPLFANLKLCEDLLIKYGGHKMAAGLSISYEKIDLLRLRLHEIANDSMYHTINVDAEITPKLININLINKLNLFKPFGTGNLKPMFLFSKYEVVNKFQMGINNKHLKLLLKKDNVLIYAIGFNLGKMYDLINELDLVDVIGNIEINDFNNRVTPQIMIKDLKSGYKQFHDYRSKEITQEFASSLALMYVHFENNFNYDNSIAYSETIILPKNVALIDMPNSLNDLKNIVNNPNVSNLFLLFKCDDLFLTEDLLSREKLTIVYNVIKKYQKFNFNDLSIINEVINLGVNKNIYLVSIQVFFELNFVIIEGEEINIVQNPQKRSLFESATFQRIINSINLKEKLLLSSSQELINFLRSL